MFLIAGCVALSGWVHTELGTRAPRPLAPAWFGAVTLLLFAAAFASWIGIAEPVVTVALWSLGLALLAARLGLTALLTLAQVGVLLTTLALCVLALIPEHYRAFDALIWNELSSTHALPVASFLGVLAVSVRRSSRRLPEGAPMTDRAGLAITAGCVVLTVFVWLNLLILNRYETTEYIALRLVRDPQRDLAMSLAWGLYALLLLGLGAALRGGVALRWMSLALLLGTIGKVFLVDLGHLEGLYRVASLAGLAISLLAVSLFYQRFVLRRLPAGGDTVSQP